MGWGMQESAAHLRRQYERDDSWLLSASASQRSLADHGSTGFRPRPQTTHGGMRSSMSVDELLRASLPSLKIKSPARNPVVGCLPDQVPETRDWATTSQRTHIRLPFPTRSGGGGLETRFGVRDEATGKTIWLATPYGAAEAMGRDPASWTGAPRPGTVASGDVRQPPRALSRTPSTLELDELLRRRSRARGRGGASAKRVDVVQSKWNVLYASGSAGSGDSCHRVRARAPRAPTRARERDPPSPRHAARLRRNPRRSPRTAHSF